MCLKLSIAINGRSCKEIKEIDTIIENDENPGVTYFSLTEFSVQL